MNLVRLMLKHEFCLSIRWNFIDFNDTVSNLPIFLCQLTRDVSQPWIFSQILKGQRQKVIRKTTWHFWILTLNFGFFQISQVLYGKKFSILFILASNTSFLFTTFENFPMETRHIPQPLAPGIIFTYMVYTPEISPPYVILSSSLL